MKRIQVVANHCSGGGTSSTSQSGCDRLKGKRCVITGAASGIGRASALLFAQQGGKVVISDVNIKGLEETKEIVKNETGQEVFIKVCDTGNEEQVKELIEFCCEKLGGIDVCFANAGIVGFGPFWDQTSEDLERLFKVNVIGVFNCFKYAAAKMEQQKMGGSLIATASVAGVRSGAGDSGYSASKAAVISLCQTVANQLTGTNIRCNAICPGLIETGMTKIVFDMADERGNRSKIGQINPLLRYGTSKEIGNLALFLASDESSYVNGQAINVCGGLTSSHPVAKRGYGRYG